MLNLQEKTERFAEEINRNAAKVIQKIEKQTEKISKNQLAELEAEAAAEMQSRMDAALQRIHNDFNREKAAFLLSCRREAAQHRDRIVAAVFAEAEEKLRGFCKTQAYAALLDRCIRALAQAMDGNCTIFVQQSDLAAANDICESIDSVIAVEPSSSIRLGLAAAESEDKAVFLSDTLDTRLGAYRETFLASCGLSVQI